MPDDCSKEKQQPGAAAAACLICGLLLPAPGDESRTAQLASDDVWGAAAFARRAHALPITIIVKRGNGTACSIVVRTNDERMAADSANIVCARACLRVRAAWLWWPRSYSCYYSPSAMPASCARLVLASPNARLRFSPNSPASDAAAGCLGEADDEASFGFA